VGASCLHIFCNISDLELERHELKLLPRSPSSFTPCLDGRYLLLGPDAELNYSEISKFSRKDAVAYPRCSLSWNDLRLNKCLSS
jgi:phytoene dehydrogenase-like protein